FDPEKHAPRLAASGAAGVLLGVWLGGWAGGGLAALGLGLLLLACWSRADGFLVFGPLVGFELTRIARRRYHFLWRGAYALGLLGVLSLVYVSALEPSWESLFSFSSSVVPIDR